MSFQASDLHGGAALGAAEVLPGACSKVSKEPSPPVAGGSPASGSGQSEGRRTSAASEACDRVLLQVITFQGWLVRFSDPRVRRDYLDGKMGVFEHSDQLLWSIDRIKEIMLPSPYHGRNRSDDPALLGRNFFARFVAKDDTAEPTDSNGSVLPVRMTYQGWFSYLGKLSSCSYWKVPQEFPCDGGPCREVDDPSKDNCASLRRPYGDGSVRPKYPKLPDDDFEVRRPGDWKPEPESRKDDGRGGNYRSSEFSRRPDSDFARAQGGVWSSAAEVPTRRDNGERDGFHLRRDSARWEFGERNRAPASLSRRHERASHQHPCDSSTESSDSMPSRGSPRRDRRSDRDYGSVLRMLNRMRFTKEVVSPGRFDGRDGSSLKQFLREFEAYFTSKFDGSEKQQARTLGDHLGGAVRRAYEAMGGSTLRYSVLKVELLSWYRGERSNTQTRSESEFRRAKMASGDSFKIYALRLERLANRAFPDSMLGRDRQLCRKFWKTVPDDFQKVLSSSERSLALHGTPRKLDWTDMMRLAESEDRFRRDRREDVSSETQTDDDSSVWYSRPETSKVRPYRTMRESDEKGSKPKVTFGPVHSDGITPSQRSISSDIVRGSPPRKLTICDWCGRRGHREDGCWTKAGACLICGSSDHSKDECPRFDREWSGFVPTCSVCGGPHLGKDCETSLNM